MGGLLIGDMIAYRTNGPQAALLHRATLAPCRTCGAEAGVYCDFDVLEEGATSASYGLVCPERDQPVRQGLSAAGLLRDVA